jgi:hypothetical protein
MKKQFLSLITACVVAAPLATGAQSLKVTHTGQYATTASNESGSIIQFSGNIDNTCAGYPGTLLPSRLDIPGEHPRRKDFMQMAALALALDLTVNVGSNACIVIGAYKIPSLSKEGPAGSGFIFIGK